MGRDAEAVWGIAEVAPAVPEALSITKDSEDSANFWQEQLNRRVRGDRGEEQRRLRALCARSGAMPLIFARHEAMRPHSSADSAFSAVESLDRGGHVDSRVAPPPKSTRAPEVRPETDERTGLVLPQRLHRIHGRRPSRREVAGEQRRDAEDQHRANQERWLAWGDAEQEPLHQARRREHAGQSER